MAIKRWKTHQYTGLEYFDLDNVVEPQWGSRDPTDVMLVQFLIADYFTNAEDGLSRSEKWAFSAIFDRSYNKGKWFVDGVYGNDTREAVLLFETATKAPYKDGIVRNICDPNVVFHHDCNYFTATKLEKLNWNFHRTHPETYDKRQEFQNNGCDALYAKIYS